MHVSVAFDGGLATSVQDGACTRRIRATTDQRADSVAAIKCVQVVPTLFMISGHRNAFKLLQRFSFD